MRTAPSWIPAPALGCAVLLFVVLATLNSAGYRYGASDQAFYAPAVIARLHPDFYPRDRALIGSQARLTVGDELIAAVARITHASVPALFAALYACTLVLLALAAASIGRLYFRTRWAILAFLAVLALRHSIMKSGTNTLEGYFHPRQVTFALGAWAVACFLRGRLAPAAALVFAGALLHPTTALWFAVWLGVAAVFADRRLIPIAAAGTAAVVVAGAWALTAGPLAGRLHVMDAEWLATLSAKDYLFPLAWPIDAWLVNMAYPVVVVLLFRRRAAAGLTHAREGAVVAGALALVAVFLVSLPFNAADVQLAIQLQPARIFWMLDFLASIYVVWALVEGVSGSTTRARVAAAVLCLLPVLRGTYVATVAFPDRPMFALGVRDSDWGRVMAWARQSPIDSQWLADPLHALLYGTSVRVAGERDVFVEAAKDQAIGMYDRGVAMRTRDRVAAIGDFHALTASRARDLASTYGIDFLVSDERLDLPVAFQSGKLRVYRLR
jgi:hypothetical protein